MTRLLDKLSFGIPQLHLGFVTWKEYKNDLGQSFGPWVFLGEGFCFGAWCLLLHSSFCGSFCVVAFEIFRVCSLHFRSTFGCCEAMSCPKKLAGKMLWSI